MTIEIELIQELQDKTRLINKKIDLPMVITIGSQSSGKSSVLEKIIKKDILPKGSDIVTRCPIKIHLRSIKNEYEHVLVDDKKFTNIFDAQQYISKKMIDICGSGSRISEQEIEIFVLQNNCVEITLLDLPGLTKIPIKDQPKDIEKQIENLVLYYASQENVLLLPIIPANSDIATCDALKLCKMIDPVGYKTFGVVTKIDIMDADTDCVDILQNKTHKLNLGYVGLINRGQCDLNNKINLYTIIEKENKYFANNKNYKNLINVGTVYFNKRLQELFVILINKSLTAIKQQVNVHLQSIKQEMTKYEATNFSKTYILSSFYKTATNILKQKHNNSTIFEYKSENNLQVEFTKSFEIKTEEYKFTGAIIEEIKNSNTILLSDNLFKKIIAERYVHLQETIIKIFDNIHDLVLSHFKNIDCVLYKNLLCYLQNELQKIVLQQKKELINDYKNYISVQMCYINIKHPDFNKSKILEAVITKYYGKTTYQKPDSNSFFSLLSAKNDKFSDFKIIDTDFDIELLKNFTNVYFNSMEKNCIDHAIKSAYYYFFVVCKNKIEKRMNDLVKENIEEYLLQDETYKIEKEKLENEGKLYQDVLQIINRYKK